MGHLEMYDGRVFCGADAYAAENWPHTVRQDEWHTDREESDPEKGLEKVSECLSRLMNLGNIAERVWLKLP